MPLRIPPGTIPPSPSNVIAPSSNATGVNHSVPPPQNMPSTRGAAPPFGSQASTQAWLSSRPHIRSARPNNKIDEFLALIAKNQSHYISLSTLPHLMLAQNSRNPGLNCFLFEGTKELLGAMSSGDFPSHCQALLMTDNQTHCVTADIFTHNNGEKTLIIMEPVKTWGNKAAAEIQYALNAHNDGHSSVSVVAVVETGVQVDASSCYLNSLMSAQELHKQKDHIVQKHLDLHNSATTHDGTNDEHTYSTPVTVLAGLEASTFLSSPRFYKNQQKQAGLEAVIKHQDELGNNWSTTEVNNKFEKEMSSSQASSYHGRKGQTLLERYNSHLSDDKKLSNASRHKTQDAYRKAEQYACKKKNEGATGVESYTKMLSELRPHPLEDAYEPGAYDKEEKVWKADKDTMYSD
jgi:hypothetical protein